MCGGQWYPPGGKGDAVVLLPGWPQTWWAYHKVMPSISHKYRIISIDIRGMGASDKPADGYEQRPLHRRRKARRDHPASARVLQLSGSSLVTSRPRWRG
ncbi:alpha/beta fold hydrolase [Halomonas elongata]|uniref:alpha/beta fold hydrolase n=1 Tax=Halomonas elongata TaxID=2746 RepID=UPI0038D4CDA4